MLDRYLNRVFANHKQIVILLTICLGVFGSKVNSLVVNHDLQVFFDGESQYLTSFTELEDEYGGEDSLYILLIPENGDVFTPELMRWLTM